MFAGHLSTFTTYSKCDLRILNKTDFAFRMVTLLFVKVENLGDVPFGVRS